MAVPLRRAVLVFSLLLSFVVTILRAFLFQSISIGTKDGVGSFSLRLIILFIYGNGDGTVFILRNVI